MGQHTRKVVESREGRWGLIADCSYAEPFLSRSFHTYSSLPLPESAWNKEFGPNILPANLIVAHEVPLASPKSTR